MRYLRARPENQRLLKQLALTLLLVQFCNPTLAHGFGQRFDLPLPLWLYLLGAGLTVAFSFLVLSLQGPQASPQAKPIARLPLSVLTYLAPLRLILRLLALGLYLLVIYAGLSGVQNPVKNIAPIMVWAIWWVGMAYVSASFGDLWSLLNPLDTVFLWAENCYLRLRSSTTRTALLRYPSAAGVWPAVVLFFVFIWMELNWEGSEQPASLAWAMLLYSVYTWLAMGLFGRASWLRHGEVFAIVFGLLARFAPIQNEGKSWRLRPYAVGLLSERAASISEIFLVILMLASVSFDGALETQSWNNLVAALTSPGLENPQAMNPEIWIRSAALLLAPLFFLLVFLACCRLIAYAGNSALDLSKPRAGTLQMAGNFVMTLIPIAIAYHFAHYLSFLVMAGQYLIPLASDPLGQGWDLFGSKLYFIRIGIVDAKMVWYVSLFAIVAGHIAAVYLAHVTALRLFSTRAAAQRSQYPMLALMVGYTMLSLWIMAQPIVSD